MGHSSLVAELFAWIVLMFVPADRGCQILDALDTVRSAAYAHNDPEALERLYSSAAAAHADRAVLQSYADRDLRVVSMQTERDSCRRSGTNSLLVVERLHLAEVQLGDGTRRALPVGAWKEREIRLVYDGHWRIVHTTDRR